MIKIRTHFKHAVKIICVTKFNAIIAHVINNQQKMFAFCQNINRCAKIRCAILKLSKSDSLSNFSKNRAQGGYFWFLWLRLAGFVEIWIVRIVGKFFSFCTHAADWFHFFTFRLFIYLYKIFPQIKVALKQTDYSTRLFLFIQVSHFSLH